LPEEVCDEVSERCAKVLGFRIDIEFRQDKELLVGLCITVGDKKVSWDLQHFLKEFQDELSKSLDRETLR